ncbi:LuxR family transcriptional regulator [Pseudonocardia sp. EC080610-09]|uniref:response regulator n=1 Tax=unclassified Pseudonocardia TaxID=2619320 RepID=UPI0006CB7819|nr:MULTISPECIES: response regulator transcription factor [unclassified Pseudonocardia]ALE71974.1 LuxR family transcriptional regulator [Pseudonocardia sp. EC080625-04]ALL75247.1 LuxR family transcriptional regulator [Pseudonocardia sp. EC080610-09]ALL82273.1 LuxR family transcriptional regulator [Pseudonocardia sp. EC080619-01]
MSIGVVLADDQEMVRTGFRLILSAESDIEVLGEAGTGDDAVAVARRLRPDVVLMDIRMPGIDGIAATRALAADPSPPRIVVVTTFDLDEYVYGALRSGACGFLLKDAGPRLLVEAVRAAAAGDALVSPSVTVRLLERLTEPPPRTEPAVALSPRELDVVRAVARGRTNHEIAGDLFVSLSTVKTHLANIGSKLDARNRVEIAAWAWENRLVG